MRKLTFCILVFFGGLLLGGGMAAQGRSASPESATASCNFADGKQITVRYDPIPFDKTEKLREGKVWMPGGAAMILFTDAALRFARKEIPMGAYTVYLIPGKNTWTFIVSKNDKPKSAYEPRQDLARGPMELGQLSQPNDKLAIYFGQMAPKRCDLRIYYGRTGAFTEIDEQ